MRGAEETRGCGDGLGVPPRAAIETHIPQSRLLLAAGVGVLPVIQHYGHAGLHSGHGIEAALPGGVKPGRLELQLVVAGHLDEGAPAESSFETSSEPGEKDTW